jgi:Zn-dependent protease
MQLDLGIQIFYFVVLIVSIIIHEVAHGYAAYMLGDNTATFAGRLTLNPVPHIDPIGSILVPIICVLSPGGFLFGWAKPVPYNPYNLRNQRWGESIVAIAGVGTNLLLALAFGLLARYTLASGMDTFAQAAGIIALVNLFLGLFNLIPIPPLDGFTFLRGLLPYRYAMGFRAFEAKLAQGGLLTLVAFLFLFSYVFAAPFGAFVSFLFHLLIGA